MEKGHDSWRLCGGPGGNASSLHLQTGLLTAGGTRAVFPQIEELSDEHEAEESIMRNWSVWYRLYSPTNRAPCANVLLPEIHLQYIAKSRCTIIMLVLNRVSPL